MSKSSALIGALALGTAVLAATPQIGHAGFTLFEGIGPNAAGIQGVVDAYRGALGALNANTPGSVVGGRREINWDGVPAALSDPGLFPGNFFNANLAGRARGAEFTTPGTGFLVSASAGGATPIAFGFSGDFTPFSPQKLFAPIGSTITDVNFFVPGSAIAATVSGFGAVFNDVEAAGTTLEAFDVSGVSLFTRSILFSANNNTLSFLGIQANAGERIARVRLTTGTGALLSNGLFEAGDGVVMDDFIYAEPLATAVIPVPASVLLFGSGLLAMVGLGRKRQSAARA